MKKLYSLAFFLFSLHLNAQPWQTMTDVPVEVAFPVIVELRGNIHVMGGGGPGGATDLHLRYTPSTNTWDTLAPVPYLAQQPAGAVVNEKIHYCGGGYPNTGTRLDHHYYYDPDSAQWYQAASMPVATAIHEAAALDGKLYVLSGQPNRTLCEYYDPVTNSWTALNPLPDMNFWYGAIVSTANSIFRFAGGGYTSPVYFTHRYDKINDTWIPMGVLPQALHALAGTALNDSLICLSGGYANGYATDSVMIYNVNDERYYYTDSLPVPRDYHSMATAGGCAFTVGGHNPADPTIGVSLLKNCAPQFPTEIISANGLNQKPYSVVITNDVFQIRWNDLRKDATVVVKLTDISGRTILQKSSNSNENIFYMNGEQLPTGIYLAIIAYDNKLYTETWNHQH